MNQIKVDWEQIFLCQVVIYSLFAVVFLRKKYEEKPLAHVEIRNSRNSWNIARPKLPMTKMSTVRVSIEHQSSIRANFKHQSSIRKLSFEYRAARLLWI